MSPEKKPTISVSLKITLVAMFASIVSTYAITQYQVASNTETIKEHTEQIDDNENINLVINTKLDILIEAFKKSQDKPQYIKPQESRRR